MKREIAAVMFLSVITNAAPIVMDYQPESKGAAIIEPCIWPKCSRQIVKDVWEFHLN